MRTTKSNELCFIIVHNSTELRYYPPRLLTWGLRLTPRGVEGQTIDRQLAFYRFNVDLPINICFYTLSPNKCCTSLNFALVCKYTILVCVITRTTRHPNNILMVLWSVSPKLSSTSSVFMQLGSEMQTNLSILLFPLVGLSTICTNNMYCICYLRSLIGFLWVLPARQYWLSVLILFVPVWWMLSCGAFISCDLSEFFWIYLYCLLASFVLFHF